MQAIEVGQVWETWGGTEKVYITSVDNSRRQPISGRVVKANGEELPCENWHSNGQYFHSHADGKSERDLVRLLTTAPINLTEQTIDTFARIARNGGKVPDGFECEGRCADGTWAKLIHPSTLYFCDNYRLTPIPQPPRFSVSTNPIGVLDSQQPGMYAGFIDVVSASEVCRRSNANHDSARVWTWTPIVPEMVPLAMADVPPGSVLRQPGTGWLSIAELTDEGVIVNSLRPDDISFADLMTDGWSILRPGQTEWQRCEKPKP